jgi:hypothetical protein
LPVTLRAALAWGIVAIAGWGGARGAFESARELASRPAADHVRVFRATPEELIALRLGPDVAIWEAVRAHAGEQRLVHVSFRNRRKDYYELSRRLTRLESLLYPIVLTGWPFDPAREPAGGAPAPARAGLVLDLDSGRDFSAWPAEVERARGKGWRLFAPVPAELPERAR